MSWLLIDDPMIFKKAREYISNPKGVSFKYHNKHLSLIKMKKNTKILSVFMINSENPTQTWSYTFTAYEYINSKINSCFFPEKEIKKFKNLLLKMK